MLGVCILWIPNFSTRVYDNANELMAALNVLATGLAILGSVRKEDFCTEIKIFKFQLRSRGPNTHVTLLFSSCTKTQYFSYENMGLFPPGLKPKLNHTKTEVPLTLHLTLRIE